MYTEGQSFKVSNADQRSKQSYLVTLEKKIGSTAISTLFLCTLQNIFVDENNEEQVDDSFFEMIVKVPTVDESLEEDATLPPVDVSKALVILSERESYENLYDLFGDQAGWLLLSYLVYKRENGEYLLFLEPAENNLKELYGVELRKDVDRQSISLTTAEIKERIADFVYICWMMYQFHLKNEPVGDVKLLNVLRGNEKTEFYGDKSENHRPLYFIDFNKSDGLLNRNKTGLISELYSPKYTFGKSIDTRATELILDMYGLMTMFYEILTRVRFESTFKEGSQQEIREAMKQDLEFTQGLVDYCDSSSSVNTLESLADLFASYFEETGLMQADVQISEADSFEQVPDQFNLKKVVHRLGEVLGLNIVTPDDDSQPWFIE
jgi:hypothetical protein